MVHRLFDVNNLQIESSSSGRAEVGALDGADDVGVAIDEPHELLQTPKTTFARAKDTPMVKKLIFTTYLELQIKEKNFLHKNCQVFSSFFVPGEVIVESL
jgi:hypothetical protein